MDADYDNVCPNHQDDIVDCNDDNECIYCSKLSYSIASRGCTELQVSKRDFVTCQNCLSEICTSCLQELIQFVEASKIPMKVKSSDATYHQLKETGTQVCLGSRTIVSGPCCSFKPQQASSTLIKTPRPDPTSHCSRIASIKRHRSTSRRAKENNLQPSCPDVLSLRQYFGNTECTSHGWGFHPKLTPRELHRKVTKKRKIRNKNVNSTYNPFSGALVFPTYGLLIEGEVTNSHWYCDHHALAKSTTDETLGVPHCVLSNNCAQLLHSAKLKLPRIRGTREVIKLAVSAPEDIDHKSEISVTELEIKLSVNQVYLQPNTLEPRARCIIKWL